MSGAGRNELQPQPSAAEDQARQQQQQQHFCPSSDPEEPFGNVDKPLLAARTKAGANYASVELDDANKYEDVLLPPTPDGYHPHLDIWRALCIAVVVLDHGNPHYSDVNTLFGQNWTLQFIFLICGICYGLTRKGIGGYLMRLVGYVFVGVCCNWLAFVIIGREWLHDPWNVVFQFWFVVALLYYSVLLLPVKWTLAWIRDRPLPDKDLTSGGVLFGLSVVAAGLAAIFLALSFGLARVLDGTCGDAVEVAVQSLGPGLSWWLGAPDKALTRLIAAFELSISNLWLALAVPMLFPTQQSITGWLILINMHARQMSTWYSGVGEKLMNGYDLMLLGLVCYYLGFKWRRPLGKRLTRYWFVWISICALVWKPGSHGRLDLLMPEDFRMRWRMQFLDTFFTVWFLAAGEKTVDPGVMTEDKCQFITYLGLFLFLVHKAIHLIFPEPWNWLIILSSIPTFCFMYKPKN